MEYDQEQGNLRLIAMSMRNFICFDSMDLKFRRNCTILTGKNHSAEKSAIIKAIEFIVSGRYLKPVPALSLMKKNVASEGFVKLKFIYTKKSEVKLLEAWRTFSSVNSIVYHEKNTVEIPIGKFQKMFELNKFLIQPYFDVNIRDDIEHDNLFNFIDESMDNLFQAFADNLKNMKEYKSSISTTALNQQLQVLIFELDNKWDLISKLYSAVNGIIKYITCNRYEIRFYIEDVENTSNSSILQKTFVKNTFDENEMLWNKVEIYLKFLIKVSLKIAIAINFNQKFVFFENMDWLEEEQNLKFFQFALLKNDYTHLMEIYNEEQINYLQRMINIFNELNLIGFFEYSNAMNITDCNIIECQLKENEPICDDMIVDYEDDNDLLSYFE